MIKYDKTNEVFALAVELVNHSARNIFLTGKAGTGKTTFLKFIQENCPKQMAIVAPTGVAAINAGGVTIHSFFQLPLSPFVPATTGDNNNQSDTIDAHGLITRLRVNKEKIKLLQELELLVIDEISMVRSDTLDAIDTVLRHIRRRPSEGFGGVQVLFIGDMFQLPPVIRDAEWKILSEFYNSPYFFDSNVVKSDPPIYIEFEKIYRQKDELFINLLNQVRNNQLEADGMELLASRFNPNFERKHEDGYIILTTHNETARSINSLQLGKLDSRLFTYKATIEDEFAQNAFPADENLQLKIGAQVMFIRNDSDKSRRFYNGKIGIVTSLTGDKVTVQCKDEEEEIEVKKEKWENIRYTLNKASKAMEHDVLGSFVQYPLRLAWAITIHKSQGLTFEKAIIDAGEAFAPGQVYVALSRCTNLEGMILQSRIRPGSFYTDRRIVEFAQARTPSNQLTRELAVARQNYSRKLLLDMYDFQTALTSSIELAEYILKHHSSFNDRLPPWMESLQVKLETLNDTGQKFQSWLRIEFQRPGSNDENTVVLDRSIRAANHFVKELDELLRLLQDSPASTDSRIHAKEYNDGLRELFGELAFKRYMIKDSQAGINAAEWHNKKKLFSLPPFAVNAYASSEGQQRTESPHPSLHYQLRKTRDLICSRKNLPIYMVAGTKTIDEMARYLPQTLDELRQVNGFGQARINQYGQEFLDVILDYSLSKGLGSSIEDKAPAAKVKKEKTASATKKSKPDTKAETFRLYNEGMKPPEIAQSRGFTLQTIEGHLCHYIGSGQLPIEDIVDSDKLGAVLPILSSEPGISISMLRQRLENRIGFGELRMIIAWNEYQKTLSTGKEPVV